MMTIDCSSHPRAARHGAVVQGLAAGSRAAHADEQSRSRCRRAARRSRRLRRHRQGGAQLGRVRRDRRDRCKSLEHDETLLVQSGKPVGVFRTHPDAPRVLIANAISCRLGDLGDVPRPRGPRPDDVRPDDRRQLDLHRHAGHPAGHLRDVRRGRRGATSAARCAAGSSSPPASAAWAAPSRSPRR